MTDSLFDEPMKESELKDVKGSIRRKYQRRLRNLAFLLDDFIEHAEARLDASKAGKIHRRDETMKLLAHCRALRAAIPISGQSLEEPNAHVYDNLMQLFGIMDAPGPDIPD